MTPDPSKAETERITRSDLEYARQRARLDAKMDAELDKCFGYDPARPGSDESVHAIVKHVYESALFHWLLVAAGYALGVLTMILWGLM